MKDIKSILDKINQSNDAYDVCKIGDTHTQSEILRSLSTALHDLAGHRIKAHEDWMSAWFNSKGKSEAAREREADFKVPELYMIRQFMQSGNKILDSLRTSISANKNG